MGFFDGALNMVSAGLDIAVKDSPFEWVNDVAQLAKGGIGMAKDGPQPGNVSDVAAGGIKSGIDLLRAGEFLSLPEDLVPGLGPLIGGAATTLGGLGGMVQHADQADEGFLSNDDGKRNEFWGSGGDALLGAIHAGLGGAATAGGVASILEAGNPLTWGLEALSLPETALAVGMDVSLSAAETFTNVVGLGAGVGGSIMNKVEGLEGDDAHNWYFGAGDVVGLAEHGLVSGCDALFDHFVD